MGGRSFGILSTAMILASVAAGLLGSPARAEAAVVTFSGTITYQGSYTADTLYVAVLDTSGAQDVTFLALHAYNVGSPPLSQPFSLDFDNAGAPATVLVAALLDVDGGGVDSVSGADIIGWYAGTAVPTGVSSATSHSGLNFAMPRAEIHGTVTFDTGQTQASVVTTQDPLCVGEEFGRPQLELTGSGSYSIIGIYAGTWCVFAYGTGPSLPSARVCYGDPTCANPTLVTLTATQVRAGVNLDFTGMVPTQATSWGVLKNRYR